MHAVRSLPFVFSRMTSTMETNNVVYMRDNVQGLLRIEGKQLHVQWRLTRSVDHYGVQVSSDSDRYPLREHAIPVSKLSEVRVRKSRFRIPFQRVLIIVSSDMQAFDPLTSDGDLPGLILAHPAELKIQVRRQDYTLMDDFASHLKTVISEQFLESMQNELNTLEPNRQRSLPPSPNEKKGT